MPRVRRWVVLLAATLTSVGCDGGDVVGSDAGRTPRGDAGLEDSGASVTDASSGFDAGPRMDGGAAAPDAGPPDPACALPAAIDEGVTYTRELHVAPAGDDGDDGSPGAPLRTIRAAADRATPGTRVVVHEGTYPAVSLGLVQGTPGAPIAFVADGVVTIDASSGVGWAMSDAAYVVVDGFTIANASIHGMNIDDGSDYATPSHHVVLRGITVRDAGSGGNNDCIKLSGVDDFWVLDGDVSGCDAGEIIDMVGCHRGVIHGNYFHDTAASGVQTKGGSADTIIHGNVFARIPGRAVNAGGSTGEPYFRPIDAPYEASNIQILANVFVENGVMGGSTVAYVGCDGCTFAHNTVIRPRRWVARILQESSGARFVPSRNGLFVNNIVVLDTNEISTYVNVGGGTAPETFDFGSNLWLATDQGSGWGGPTYGSGIPPEHDSLIQVDPAMVDRAGGDYRLTARSPAAGAARALSLPARADHDGRCYADPASLGAFAAP